MTRRAEGAPEPFPLGLRPMLAVPGALPDAPGWSYEFKWDGVRALVGVLDAGVRISSRLGNEVSVSYPELAVLRAALRHTPVLLDGEVVSLDARGRPDFAALQRRMHVGDPAAAANLAAGRPVTYLAFDVLHLAGRSTRELPYTRRREILEGLLADSPRVAVPPSFDGAGASVLEAARGQGLEGVVAKQAASPYSPGSRTGAWVKVKLVRHQEVVVIGWRPGAGRRLGGVGSLLLAVPGPDGALRYAGHVGTGFTDTALDQLARRLAPLRVATPEIHPPPPREHARTAVWVRPELVGEVAYAEWTPEGRLRHPSWRGLRPDKTPGEVRCEP